MNEKNIPDYPANSHKIAAEEPNERKRVITGGVRKTKKRLGGRILRNIVAEDVDDAKSHIIFNMIIPAIKRTLSDAFDYFLNGDNSRRRPETRSYTNYSAKFSTDRSRYSVRDLYEIDDVVLDTRGDAELVLDDLCERIEKYGKATVADLYNAVGVTPQHTDYNYGWTSLKTASVVRVRDGYWLKLPRISPFER